MITFSYASRTWELPELVDILAPDPPDLPRQMLDLGYFGPPHHVAGLPGPVCPGAWRFFPLDPPATP